MEPLAPDEASGGLSRPVCSIVIPTYHGRRLLEPCLESLFRHLPRDPALACEVVVSDNGPGEETRQWLAQAHPRVRVVRLAPGQGFCRAANAGIEAARGRFIQVLNDDTELTPGWIEAGLEPFRDPTVGAVTPLVLVRATPERVDSAGDSYSLAGWPSKRGHGQSVARWASRPVEDVMSASGSASFYRAEALQATGGGFDASLVSYYEDVDLGFRLRWAGYRVVFTPHCRVLHDISATADHRSPRLQRLMARNAELVFWSNLPARKLALAFLPHVGLVLAQAAWRMARLRFIPFYLGKIDAARELGRLSARRKLRAGLGRNAVRPPHFPMGLGSIEDVVNHLRRPRETSALRDESRA
ncbi:glycosyltransferase family 2 protein [Planctomyces sp. SH-PL62]|uniref:glycosyltransferase family 2 protein n=1 Tax=Planctomyces sp. SH-PL62 TaxID=1636152 RepID=UPI00078D7082|nr:glycosyltransferase family 2 protein [Planctomyces sp. SH-PL62]AMV39985.1 N-acetylglucosaminyl-diphospho-decaprenol L-rhamnosyltransferase [Planctomyces sp. SH-PL62]